MNLCWIPLKVHSAVSFEAMKELVFVTGRPTNIEEIQNNVIQSKAFEEGRGKTYLQCVLAW